MNRDELRVVNEFLTWFESLGERDANIFMRVIGTVVRSIKVD